MKKKELVEQLMNNIRLEEEQIEKYKIQKGNESSESTCVALNCLIHYHEGQISAFKTSIIYINHF